MEKQALQAAERQIDKAITEDEKANSRYYEILRSFISGGSRRPQTRLDSAGLKTIEAAWIRLNDTNKNLRRAYMKLYSAYL